MKFVFPTKTKLVLSLVVMVFVASISYVIYSSITFIPPDISTINRIRFMKRRIIRYAREHDTLPVSLSDLAEMPGYDNRLIDRWKRPIIYQVGSNDTILLMSFGEDGKRNTDDDIVRVFRTRTKNGEWLDELDTIIEIQKN